jgi:hypothetical protein
MDDVRITADQLKAAMSEEVDQLCVEMAEAMNNATPGRIIADSEEPVRDAHAVFRQRAYQKAVELVQAKRGSFSPSAPGAGQQGQADHYASDDQRAG